MKLICPICHQHLTKEKNSMICENHHTFDFNKAGYLYLYQTNKKEHGDNKEMVLARTKFLSTNAYQFLRDALVSYTKQTDSLLDLACGEGYYTSALLGTEKYGIDLSKDALRHASKNDASTNYILTSIFSLPFEDNTFDTVITCFAPVSSIEIPRVLKKDGTFVLVTPGEDHLFELKELLYEKPYKNIIKDIDIGLNLVETKKIKSSFSLDHEHLLALFQMTPYAYKTGKEGLQKLNSISSLTLTAEFIIRVFKKES